MMESKVAELSGPELDRWVAQADGWAPSALNDQVLFVLRRGREVMVICAPGVSCSEGRYCPSVDWSHGGPIIEREQITIVADKAHDSDGRDLEWSASVGAYAGYIDD
jgi:hypothetical protein